MKPLGKDYEATRKQRRQAQRKLAKITRRSTGEMAFQVDGADDEAIVSPVGASVDVNGDESSATLKALETISKKAATGIRYGNDIRALTERVKSLNQWFLNQDESTLVPNASTFWKSFKLSEKVHRERLSSIRAAFVRNLSVPLDELLRLARKNKKAQSMLKLVERFISSDATVDKGDHKALRKALTDVVQRYDNMETCAALVVALLVLAHDDHATGMADLQYDSLKTFFGEGMGNTGEEILIRCASIVGEQLILLAVPMNILMMQATRTNATAAVAATRLYTVYTAVNMHSSVDDMMQSDGDGAGGGNQLPHTLQVVPMLPVHSDVTFVQTSLDAFNKLGGQVNSEQFAQLEKLATQSAMDELRANGERLLCALQTRQFSLDLRPLDIEKISMPTGLFIHSQ